MDNDQNQDEENENDQLSEESFKKFLKKFNINMESKENVSKIKPINEIPNKDPKKKGRPTTVSKAPNLPKNNNNIYKKTNFNESL